MTYIERQQQLRQDADKVREMKKSWPLWKQEYSLGPVPRSPDLGDAKTKSRSKD